MSSLEIFNFENHRDKCRCCLRPFDKEDDQIKVTEAVQKRFLELTQLKLEVGDSFSSVICERCNKELRSFSSWRQELLNKQLRLCEFEEDLKITEVRHGLRNRDGSEEVQTLTEHDDSDCFEIKVETGENVFSAGTALNSLTPAPAKARNHKTFRNPESKEFEEDLRITEERRDLDASEEAQMLVEHYNDPSDSVEIKAETGEYAFDDNNATNDQYSSPHAQTTAGSPQNSLNRQSKILRDQAISTMNFSAQASSDGEAEMSQHELVGGLEDQPVQRPQEPEPQKRGSPRKGQERELRGKRVTRRKKNFFCHECENTFAAKQNLQWHHDAVHLKIKRFECDFCGFKCYKKQQMSVHVSRHFNCEVNARPFPCNIKGCTKFFKTKAGLQQHSIAHSNNRPYRCHCGKAFKRAFDLKCHQNRKHTGQ